VVYDINILPEDSRRLIQRGRTATTAAHGSDMTHGFDNSLAMRRGAARARALPGAFSTAGRRDTRIGVYGLVGKRLLDCLFILMALPVVLPVVLLFALAVARDGGSAFYWQRRIGRHGRAFRMMKLRTMVPDADKALEAHLDSDPEARREWDLKQKLSDDPRITRLGHFLRATSLDELPQLWNVLKGDMSLVGPRPMMLDQASLYPDMDTYTQMRPGITGLWQVSERNESRFADRAKFDLTYLKSMSLWTDMSILFRTVTVVMKRTGC
jgi:exopolysaccharide production protein ExoY